MRTIYTGTSPYPFDLYESAGDRGFEDLYQKLIERLSGKLFSDWYCLPFNNVTIRSTVGKTDVRPDLVMVSKDLEEWVIVEVELPEHGSKHIGDQLEKFLNGIYGDEIYPTLLNTFATKGFPDLAETYKENLKMLSSAYA